MGRLRSKTRAQTKRGRDTGQAEVCVSGEAGLGRFISLPRARHGAWHICAPGQLEGRPSPDPALGSGGHTSG